MRIRNFDKFQHFKDRRPPWIKLYRDLLDDIAWHDLDDKSAKVLVMLWLIASEDQEGNGTLPDIRTLAFRLRMKENDLEQRLTKLNNWLIHDDIDLISEGYQEAIPETETETETETDTGAISTSFQDWYERYPKKVAKPNAEKSWRRLKPNDQAAALAALSSWPFSTEQRFVPNPATWLNQRRWEDDPVEPTKLNGHDEPGAWR